MKLKDEVVYSIDFEVNDKKVMKEIRVDLEINQQGFLTYKGYFIHEEHIKFEGSDNYSGVVNDFMFKGKNPISNINYSAEKAYCEYYVKESKGVILLDIKLDYNRSKYKGMCLDYKYSSLYNGYSKDKKRTEGSNGDYLHIFKNSQRLNPLFVDIKFKDCDGYILEIEGGFINLMLNPPPDNTIQVYIPRKIIETAIFNGTDLFGVFADYIYKILNLKKIDDIRDKCNGLPYEIEIGNINTCELFIVLESGYEKVLVKCRSDKVYDYFDENGRLNMNDKAISELINYVCGKKVSNYKKIVEELESKVKYLEENIDNIVKEKISSLIK